MAIDWDLNRKMWNKENKTNYATKHDFVAAIYKEYKTCQKCGEALCVAHTSFHRVMVATGIPRGVKGHRFPSPAQEKVLAMDTKDMYRWQIALEAGITTAHAWLLLKRANKQYKRLRNQFSY